MKTLAKQCSTQEALQYILKHLFFILNGGEGKLTSSVQKCMVLAAIGNCSLNSSFSNQEILQQLLDSYSEFLKVETHEATLHFGFEQLIACLKNIHLSNFQAAFLLKVKEFFKVTKINFFLNLV